jgi:hypothetical protein
VAASNLPYQPKLLNLRVQYSFDGLLYQNNENVDPSADGRGAAYVVALPPLGPTGAPPVALGVYVAGEVGVGAAGLLTANGFNDSPALVYVLFMEGNTPGDPAAQSFRLDVGAPFSWTPADTQLATFADLYVVASSNPAIYTPVPGHNFWLRAEYFA